MTQQQVRVKTSDGWQDLIVPGPQGQEGPVGGPGPTGPQGAPGTGGFDQTYLFNVPSASWEIVHGQGSYALNVETLDINGLPFEGDVFYPDPDTIRIDMYSPQTGVARVYR